MSGNYTLLHNKAEAVAAAVEDLRTKKQQLVVLEKEAIQTKAAFDAVSKEYEKRKTQASLTEEDKEKLEADLAKLISDRAELIAEKAAAFTAYSAALTALDTANTARDTLIGEEVSSTASPPVTTPSGIRLLQSELVTLNEQADVISHDLVTARGEAVELKATLDAKKVLLQDLKDTRDSLPAGTARDNLTNVEIPAKEAEVTAAQGAYDSKLAEVEGFETSYTNKTAEATAKQDAITGQMELLREKEREIATLKEDVENTLAEYADLANKLQDIEGTADQNDLLNDGNVTVEADADADGGLDDGQEGSQLFLLTKTVYTVGEVHSQYIALRDSLNTAKTARKATMDSVASAKVAKEREVANAETTLATLRRQLDSLLDIQKKIEIDAAVALLEDFLKNGAVVLAAAPNVELEVAQDVAKTCPESKVRALLSRIRASYTDPEEYKRLLDEFRADPVGSFFNDINDPCFVLLSEEEVEEFRADIRAAFLKAAKALFAKYFPGSVKSSSLVPLLVFLAVIVALVVAIYFFYIRA